MMKMTVTMSQDEIKQLIKTSLQGRGINVSKVNLNITKGYSDPRESVPDSVTASADVDLPDTRPTINYRS